MGMNTECSIHIPRLIGWKHLVLLGFFLALIQPVKSGQQNPESHAIQDISRLKPSERAAAIRAVIINKINFNEVPLIDCLKELSKQCTKATGMGFSIIAK